MPGATALVALILSGAMTFAAVIGIAGVVRPPADLPLAPALAAPARPWTRPPPPAIHPLDDRATVTPVPMHEAKAGEMIYQRSMR